MDLPRPVSDQTLPHDVLVALRTGPDLLATWWPCVVAVALGLALIGLVVHRRRRRLRRWPLSAAAVAVLVVAAVLGVNTYSGYVPSAAAAWLLLTDHQLTTNRSTGEVISASIVAPVALRVPRSTTWIYTPPGYDPHDTIRYPVVYLLHGTPGQSSDWLSAGDVAHVMDVLIADELIRPMIVVAPDTNGKGPGGGDTECLDSTRGGSQVETYLTKVVVPWVDAHFLTRADWQHRVIGGMSSGGYAALDQGLRHPELFGAIIALEPYDNPGSGGRHMLSTSAEYVAHSPGRYLSTMTFTHPVPTFLSIGGRAHRSDFADTQRLAAQLQAQAQPMLFRSERGQGHTWTTARTAIPYGLAFVSDTMAP